MLKIALLVLTINPDGAIQTTVSEADNMAQCQEQLATVQGLLQKMEVEIAHISCKLTTANVTAFEHGLGPEAYKYHYKVEVGAEQFALTLSDGASCVADTGAATQTYCTISSQAPIDE